MDEIQIPAWLQILAFVLTLIGGPTAILAFVQHKQARRKDAEAKQAEQIEAAKKEALAEAEAKQRKVEIDAAHKKIREDIMPKLGELQSQQAEDKIRQENLMAAQVTTNATLEKVAESVMYIRETVAGLAAVQASNGAKGRRGGST